LDILFFFYPKTANLPVNWYAAQSRTTIAEEYPFFVCERQSFCVKHNMFWQEMGASFVCLSFSLLFGPWMQMRNIPHICTILFTRSNVNFSECKKSFKKEGGEAAEEERL